MTGKNDIFCTELKLAFEISAVDQPAALAAVDLLVDRFPLDALPSEFQSVTTGDLWKKGDRRPDVFTSVEMEAALCVREWIIEATSEDGEGWPELRQRVGKVELRHASIALGKWCLSVYDVCAADDPDNVDGVSYDWEVIPVIMSYARDYSGPVYVARELPSPFDVAPKVLKELRLLQPEQGVLCWSEGDEDNLSFFSKSAVSEQRFPAFSGVELVIDQQGAEAVLRLMDIVEERRHSRGHTITETLFHCDPFPRISVFTDGCDPDLSFNSDSCRLSVTSGTDGETVVFETLHKHTDDTLRSSGISRDQLLLILERPRRT